MNDARRRTPAPSACFSFIISLSHCAGGSNQCPACIYSSTYMCAFIVWFSCSLGLPTEGIYCVPSLMTLAVFFCFFSLNILSLRSIFRRTKAVVSPFSVVPEMLSLECQLSPHKLMCLNAWSPNGGRYLQRLWNL